MIAVRHHLGSVPGQFEFAGDHRLARVGQIDNPQRVDLLECDDVGATRRKLGGEKLLTTRQVQASQHYGSIGVGHINREEAREPHVRPVVRHDAQHAAAEIQLLVITDVTRQAERSAQGNGAVGIRHVHERHRRVIVGIAARDEDRAVGRMGKPGAVCQRKARAGGNWRRRHPEGLHLLIGYDVHRITDQPTGAIGSGDGFAVRDHGLSRIRHRDFYELRRSLVVRQQDESPAVAQVHLEWHPSHRDAANAFHPREINDREAAIPAQEVEQVTRYAIEIRLLDRPNDISAGAFCGCTEITGSAGRRWNPGLGSHQGGQTSCVCGQERSRVRTARSLASTAAAARRE